MGAKAKYMYDKYTSLYDWCLENNRDYRGIVQRIVNTGCTVSEAIKADIATKITKKDFVYGGLPLSKYCKLNGLDYNKVFKRIQRGRTIEEAINFNDNRYKGE